MALYAKTFVAAQKKNEKKIHVERETEEEQKKKGKKESALKWNPFSPSKNILITITTQRAIKRREFTLFFRQVKSEGKRGREDLFLFNMKFLFSSSLVFILFYYIFSFLLSRFFFFLGLCLLSLNRHWI